MRYKIGQKVIHRTNEDEPYRIGSIFRYDDMLKSPDDIPTIKFDDTGEPKICMGITVPYCEEIAKRLDKLTPKQQWELLWAIKDNGNGKQFIIMRGCPGSGKSTKAKKLAGTNGQIFSTDDYFMIGGEYKWEPAKIGAAHSWNQKRALAAVKANIPIIIIDNTNTTIREMRSYLPHIEMARLNGYQIMIEEPETYWRLDIEELDKRNTHNVPKQSIQKMLNRYVSLPMVEDILFSK